MDQISLFRLFITIADNGSLVAAARSLAIAPSVATLGLQRLEEMVGVVLVTRTTRRLSLTPEGERFLLDCRRILTEIQEAMDSLSDSGPLRGDIRVTATSDFGRNSLAPVIDGFMRCHPEVRMSLFLSDSVLDLTEAGFDVALRMGSPSKLHSDNRLLVRGTRQVCASPDYWKQKGKPSHPNDLLHHNCMVLARPDAPQSQWHFQDGSRDFAVRVSGDRTANEGNTLRNWAIAGAGVVLKSSIDIAADVAEGRLVPVLEEYELAEPNLYNLYAVVAPGRRQSRRIRAFVDYLQNSFGHGIRRRWRD
ncbi:LysR family transcriptional regulator [Corticibacter populi]|uniref:LysR family transcriptional regulator n=1 Tax=Corticibacter populi TaxID=1550736 RepID=A0A3M6QV29_9BURK|nr:LysR family transcriptional regulator [Corticibacter populi]RMX06877.1 LysR family transcriptional regulator [Corticibacter populi]RZS31529.1 DNA-binding transcriptional LysR family regulator [Corticibacter populi]